MENKEDKERMLMLKYREDLLGALSHSEKFIDQVIASLTIGILGFTMAFKERFLGSNSNTNMLKASWTLLLASVSLIIVANYFSGLFSRIRLREVDKAIAVSYSAAIRVSKGSQFLENVLYVVNAVICLSFLAGLITLVCFVMRSL